MKIREYFFIALIVMAVVWFMQPNKFGPTPDNQRPILTAVVKFAKWIGWAALFAEEPPPAPEQAPVMAQTDPMPLEVVNEPPQREVVDGVAQIKHGEGW